MEIEKSELKMGCLNFALNIAGVYSPETEKPVPVAAVLDIAKQLWEWVE
jgi:hypothetical protein